MPIPAISVGIWTKRLFYCFSSGEELCCGIQPLQPPAEKEEAAPTPEEEQPPPEAAVAAANDRGG